MPRSPFFRSLASARSSSRMQLLPSHGSMEPVGVTPHQLWFAGSVSIHFSANQRPVSTLIEELGVGVKTSRDVARATGGEQSTSPARNAARAFIYLPG